MANGKEISKLPYCLLTLVWCFDSDGGHTYWRSIWILIAWSCDHNWPIVALWTYFKVQPLWTYFKVDLWFRGRIHKLFDTLQGLISTCNIPLMNFSRTFYMILNPIYLYCVTTIYLHNCRFMINGQRSLDLNEMGAAKFWLSCQHGLGNCK